VGSKSPAEHAGLTSGDRILAVDGVTVYHFEQFVQLVNGSKGKPIKLSVDRKGKRTEKMATPVKREEKYVIGVEIQMIVSRVFKKYGLFESMKLGVEKTLEIVDLTFITLRKLLTLKLSIKNLGGPVMIAQMSGQAAAAGLSTFLSLLAVISISLGMLNLLPIPVLDGGLILFLIIEAIRKKPLSRRTMEISQSIGATVLIILIAVVSYNDIMRAFFSK
jgi:regulator of sigma E protease